MKVAVLTTETTHHAFFIRELQAVFPDVFCVVETETLAPPFEVAHPFETERNSYETEVFFKGKNTKLSDLCRTVEVSTVNDDKALDALAKASADCVVVFGTRKIKPPLIQKFKGRVINLHGGDPELYRGLDSHLWGIYHRDFNSLVTTLHELNETLDDGAIIGQEKLVLKKNMQLHELRKVNTDATIHLTVTALKEWEARGRFTSRPQAKVGRYYSFMPKVLKDLCVTQFEKFTARLA